MPPPLEHPPLFELCKADSKLGALQLQHCPLKSESSLSLTISSSSQLASEIGTLTDAILLKLGLSTDFCLRVCLMASTVQPSKWVSKLQGWAYWLKRHEAITLAVALSMDLGMDLKIECCKMSRSHRFTLFYYLCNCLESVPLVCLKHDFCPLIALHHLLRITYFFGLIYWHPRYLLP